MADDTRIPTGPTGVFGLVERCAFGDLGWSRARVCWSNGGHQRRCQLPQKGMRSSVASSGLGGAGGWTAFSGCAASRC